MDSKNLQEVFIKQVNKILPTMMYVIWIKRDDGLQESFIAMQQYCSIHGGKIEGSWQQNYGYVMEIEH